MPIRIRTNLDASVNILANYPKITGRYLQQAIMRYTFLVEKTAIRKAPSGISGAGGLRGSISSRFGILKGIIEVNKNYAVYVHQGTRPHWPPYGPGTPLARWAQLKSGIPAFLVARAIARKGTKAQPFLEESINSTTRDAERLMEVAVNRIMDDIAKQIEGGPLT